MTIANNAQGHMNAPLTISDVRAHGVTRLLVFCRGKRENDWPCHHEGMLSVDGFVPEETLKNIESLCRCTACGWRRADLRPDYSVQRATRQSIGWIMPPVKGAAI
jgi:hypothetical protein